MVLKFSFFLLFFFLKALFLCIAEVIRFLSSKNDFVENFSVSFVLTMWTHKQEKCLDFYKWLKIPVANVAQVVFRNQNVSISSRDNVFGPKKILSNADKLLIFYHYKTRTFDGPWRTLYLTFVVWRLNTFETLTDYLRGAIKVLKTILEYFWKIFDFFTDVWVLKMFYFHD